MATTSIEWTRGADGSPGMVWNPTTGCDRVSSGCDHCYAMTMAKRLKGMGSAKYQTDGDPRTSGPGFGVAVHNDALTIPLRIRKPRRIFVNSMSDLFHDGVPDDYIAQVFAVMAAAPQHTFQILTKRHARMRSLLTNDTFRESVFLANNLDQGDILGDRWPLPNCWLGVSVENQQWADIRVPALLNTPAVVRWISAEPLLGPVHLLNPWLTATRRLDWVVTGGESGPGARPAHPDWFRSLRDQCVTASVPFLFKQWGEWQDGSRLPAGRHDTDHVIVIDGRHEPVTAHFHGGTPATDLTRARLRNEPGTASATIISRVGKKAAGRLLDGRTWDQYPNVEEATP